MPGSSPAITLTSTIVTFRWNSSGLAPGAAKRGEELALEAETLGATLCAFGPFEISFAFQESDLPDAAEFAARAVKQLGELGRAGMAVGEVTTFLDGDGFIQLAFGPPVVMATALARYAQPGEVLVDNALEGSGLRFAGDAREITLGGKPRRIFLLDPERPSIEPEEIDPAATVVDGAPAADLSMAPGMVDESALADTVQAAVANVTAPRGSDLPAHAHALIGLAREALEQSDQSGFTEAIARMNLADELTDVVERLAALFAARGGAKEEGLRRLRRAAETEERDDKRTRAVLAYAIGVAGAGRQDEALLEGLAALAIARSRGDKSGEKACTRFLSQLSYATGHPEAASAWEHVARAIELES